VDWIRLAQHSEKKKHSSEHGNEPSGSIKAGNFLTGLDTVSCRKRSVLRAVCEEIGVI
jgi:hypothetical protein